MKKKSKCDRCGKSMDFFYEVTDTLSHTTLQFCEECGRSFGKWFKALGKYDRKKYGHVPTETSATREL